MKRARSLSLGPMWRLRLVAVVLAVAGQLGLTGASLALARDESSTVSHAERTGIALHHGHAEATCAACAALSFHANVNAVAPAASLGEISGGVLALRSSYCVAGAQGLPNSCRAPPREV